MTEAISPSHRRLAPLSGVALENARDSRINNVRSLFDTTAERLAELDRLIRHYARVLDHLEADGVLPDSYRYERKD